MTNFIIMFICLLAGQFIRRRANFRISDVRPLNIVVLWLSLPALIFVQVPVLFRSSSLTSEVFIAVAMPWLCFLASAAVFALLGRWRGWSLGVIGALTLTAGLGNTSFVGLPVVEALIGDAGVRVAILLDQLGTFLIVATLGLLVASFYSGREFSLMKVIKRVVFFPSFIAFVVAVAWGLSSLPIEGVGMEALKKLGATLVPLALLSVGWQLDLKRATFKRYFRELSWGLGFKLAVWPALTVLVLHAILNKSSLVYRVTTLEAAMAPMITAAVVATEFELESELAQLMVGLGIPLSALTLFIWTQVFKAL